MWKILKRPLDLASFIFGFSPENRPFFVHFEPTLRCNMRCWFCNVWRHNPFPVEASTEVFKRRLEEAWDMGCRLVSFTGGEPLMRSDIGELVKHSLDLGFYVGLVTNGLLIDVNLENLQGLDTLAVSFTFDEDNYNNSRGVNAFSKVKRNILLAKDSGLKPDIYCTLDQKSMKNLYKTIAFAKDNGLRLHLNLVSELPREGTDKINWPEVKIKEADETLDKIREAKKSYSGIRFNDYYLSRGKGKSIEDYLRCQAARTVVALKPDASISLPCAFHSVLNSGERPLLEFWGSEEARDSRRLCGGYSFCDGCDVSCMYVASLIGHPFQTAKWLTEVI